jgi:outer membrane protein OmpU
MKKILLATAALSAMTGYAAAEVTVTGSARMGLVYDGNDTFLTSRVRVSFAMMGTTDGGLEFGASVRADQNGGNGLNVVTIFTPGPDGVFGTADDVPEDVDVSGNTGDTNNDSTVYIKGAFGKLTFGDNDSAANALVGHVSGVGLTGLGDWNELRYLGQTDTSALYEYSSGALTFAASTSQLTAGDEAMSLAAKYSTDTFSVALGWEDASNIRHIALGGSATFGAATVKAVISDTNISGDPTQYAVSVDYVAGAGTYTAFVTDEGDTNNFGLGAAYDLGGGATLKAGVARDDAGSNTVADIGIAMSF